MRHASLSTAYYIATSLFFNFVAFPATPVVDRDCAWLYQHNAIRLQHYIRSNTFPIQIATLVQILYICLAILIEMLLFQARKHLLIYLTLSHRPPQHTYNSQCDFKNRHICLRILVRLSHSCSKTTQMIPIATQTLLPILYRRLFNDAVLTAESTYDSVRCSDTEEMKVVNGRFISRFGLDYRIKLHNGNSVLCNRHLTLLA